MKGRRAGNDSDVETIAQLQEINMLFMRATNKPTLLLLRSQQQATTSLLPVFP